MKRLLRSPIVNAVCISTFTIFYAIVFYTTSRNMMFDNSSYKGELSSFWSVWSRFLDSGYQHYISTILIVVTIIIVVLLVIRHQPYDEYHTSILTHCLVIAAVLTLIAIAVFYLIILSEPIGMIEKFTLFIMIHWATVVFANLVYVLLCRWR